VIKEQPFYKGRPVNLAGKTLSVDSVAPTVSLVGGDLSAIPIGGAKEKTQLIIAFLSVDTPICATELRNFNAKCATLDNAEAIAASMDLPFAQDRFASIEGIDKLVFASDFRAREFGRAYGVLISDGALEGLLTRAVFVVAPDGRIVYKEIVGDVGAEPNYDAAIQSVKSCSQTL
jgi:thiol peroxidase